MRNHSGLRYLFDQLNLNVRKVRWFPMINQFDFDIRNIKRNENEVANVLSRRVVMQVTSKYGHKQFL